MDKEALKQTAFAFITEQIIGVISTVGQDNTPESASVNYLLDTDWTLYILTDKDSRKVQNLRQNPHAAFVVGTAPVPKTAQMQATAEIIDDDNPNFETAKQKLVDSKRLDRDPIYNIFGNNYVILKLKIDWLRWLYFDQASGDPVYTILIP